MANTYTQLHIQIVFAVKHRQNLIQEKNREELQKYICGIINNKTCKPLAIYCNPDHIHILIGLRPKIALSDLVRDIKANSSKYINNRKWVKGKFEWQSGFSAFTYSKSQLGRVIKYIENQHEHHRKKTFQDEYLTMLKKAEIEYEERYLFDWYHETPAL